MVIYLLNNNFLNEDQLEQYDILFLQEIVPDAVKILESQFKEYVIFIIIFFNQFVAGRFCPLLEILQLFVV